jgi:hypothetical protein
VAAVCTRTAHPVEHHRGQQVRRAAGADHRRRDLPDAGSLPGTDGDAYPDTHSDANADADGDANAHAHANANGHRDGYADGHADGHGYGHGDGHADADAHTYAHTDPDGVTCQMPVAP